MRKIILYLALLALAGCSFGQSAVRQPGNIKDYRNIAVVSFSCSEPAVGQKTAGKFGVRLANRGFKVIDESRLKKLVSEEKLMKEGLTGESRSELEKHNIQAVVFGSITRYECDEKKVWSWTGFAPEKRDKSRCFASLSMKMVDTRSGEVVWETSESHTEYAEGMTEKAVLGIVIARIEERLPEVR